MWYVARKKEVSIETDKMPAGMAAGREKDVDLVWFAMTARISFSVSLSAFQSRP